jgi:hypothetical protein
VVTRARKSLKFFAEMVGWPLAGFQLEALTEETRQVCLVAARQVGKSRSLAVYGCWKAYRLPKQLILVVSAGQTGADRLLATMAEISGAPLLRESVGEAFVSRIVLSNGSEIRSFPASSNAVRGWSADVLLIDEASGMTEELWAAALPTTAARPAAVIVLASSPFGDSGPFYDLAMDGLEPGNPVTRTWTWSLEQAPWITPEVIEAARRSLSPLKFRAEYLGEWIAAGNSYFDRDDIDACVCPFEMTRDGGGAPATMGLDWGKAADRSAIAVCGLLDDHGVNGRPVVVLAYCETARRDYSAQCDEVEAVAAGWKDLRIFSESVGVGAMPTERVRQRLPQHRVEPVRTSAKSKEDAYGKLALMLSERAIVLPDHPELIKQLKGIVAAPRPSGGLRIEARTESLHDDLPDAVTMALAGLPDQLAEVPVSDVPAGTAWAQTLAGVRVPVPVRVIAAEASYLDVYGKQEECPGCGHYYAAGRPACQWCGTVNGHYTEPGPAAAGSAILAASAARPGPEPEPEPVTVTPGGWASAYYPRHPVKCPAGHTYDGKANGGRCPDCIKGTLGFLRGHGQRPGGFGGMGFPRFPGGPR